MKTKLLALAATAALATPALAAETFNVDKPHSTVSFQIRHFMSQVAGRFQEFEGSIQVDRAKPEASSVEFTIKATTIDTNEARRDQHLRSGDFFDVAKNPTISFKSTSMKPTGKDSYQVTGAFTMHGVTKEITLPVTVLGEMTDPWGNKRIGFETSTTINRKDYGINWNQALDQGGFVLGDDVKVSVNIEAVQQKTAAK
jgi:polyisoprenoid-binding protein YceI